MPHALTQRQIEYLEFIKHYIGENQDTPSLKEIATHFQVKSPSAHKVLKALQQKGYVFFLRSSTDGFYIRLVERGGMREQIFPLFIVGKIDQYGEVRDLFDLINIGKAILSGKGSESMPEQITIVHKCDNPHSIFGLKATQRIPEASIEAGDILVVDTEKKSQQGFMSLLPVGPEGRLFLCWAQGKSFDDQFFSLEMKEPYPVPEELLDEELGQRMFWHPIAWNDETDNYFSDLAKNGGFPEAPIPMDLVGGTVLEIIREY